MFRLPFSSTREKEDRLLLLSTASEVTQHMPHFLASCYRYDLDPVVLGLGSEWPGNGMKIRLILPFVRALRRETLVLFMDAYDSILVREPGEIVRKYRRFGHPLVFTAEKSCWPLPELSEEYPPSPTEYRYLNSGGWIGQAGYVADLLERWDAEVVPRNLKSDQSWWHRRVVAEPGAVALDYHCSLFQTVKRSVDELEDHDGAYNRVTGTHPCVIHANAGWDITPYLRWSGKIGESKQ